MQMATIANGRINTIALGALAACAIGAVFAASGEPPQRRPIKIAAFGTLTGPVRSFGTNSRAALQAAAERIDAAGGVKLRDGSIGTFDVTYDDDHCRADEAIGIVQRAAASDAILGIGPSCSSVAEPLFGVLQGRVDDAADRGLQLPIFTDGATKADLAKISQWAFRNAPNEGDMYKTLWKWVSTQYPDLKTVYAGEEGDFAHSHSTWEKIIKVEAEAAGFTVTGSVSWSINDTTFAAQAGSIAAAGADVVVISAHALSTCGVLKELARLKYRPKLLVGLTSSSTPETLKLCGADAEGLLIPTSFIATTPETIEEALEVSRCGGIADLHGMAAWEILYTVKRVIEEQGISATPASVQADRRKLRDGLAGLETMQGSLGTIKRRVDRESLKPFVLAQVQGAEWKVVFTPPT
jgi:branched-chain amino acid transport system substrate-binding protein